MEKKKNNKNYEKALKIVILLFIIYLIFKLKKSRKEVYMLLGEKKNLLEIVKGLEKTILNQSYHLGKKYGK